MMARNQTATDVLVLGDHPAAYFAAMLLRQKGALRVVHSTLPEEHCPDRLCLINPALCSLHPALESLGKKVGMTGVWGVQFLGDDPSLRTEHRGKSALASVAGYATIRDAIRKLADKEGAELRNPKGPIAVHLVDEQGMEVSLGKETVRAKVLLLAGELPDEPSRILGVPQAWPRETLRRMTFVRLKSTRLAENPSRPLVPMSLDLNGKLTWAWALPGKDEVQLVVEQQRTEDQDEPRQSGPELLAHWAAVLQRHGILQSAEFPKSDVQSMDVPLAGALEREGVANRTLLIGPAGGFFSATGEDIYPNCWSAVFAVDTVKKALKERHLQDALQPYRQRWGATLGDYLRGPQQNLRFLMPLVYRNPVMTMRLSESILLGKQVVR